MRRALAIALLTLLALAVAAGARMLTFGPPRALAPAGTDSVEHGVAYTAWSTAMLWFDVESGPLARHATALYVVKRYPNGGLKPRKLLLVLPPRADFPDAGFDAAGNAVVVYEQAQPYYAVRAAIQQADGSFLAPATLSTPGQAARVPSLAVNHRGGAVVVWFENFPDGWRLRAALRAPKQPFGPAVDVAGPYPTRGGASASINDAGHLALAWWTGAGLGVANGELATGLRSAQTLSLDKTAFLQAVATGPDGRDVVAWGTYLPNQAANLHQLHVSLAQPGRPFGPPLALGRLARDADFRPAAAVTTTGVAIVAVDAGPRGMLVYTAPPRQPFRLGPQVLGATVAASSPALAVGPTGVLIAYDDDVPSATVHYAVRVAFARPDGRFGPSRRISSPRQEALVPIPALAPNGSAAVDWIASTQGFANGNVLAAFGR